MSKQRELLPGIIASIAEWSPECGVLLMGSLQGGWETPDSDIDLYVLTEDVHDKGPISWRLVHEERGMKLLEKVVSGITVHFVWWPIKAVEESLTREPYVHYPFSQAEVLHDPLGVARHYRDMSARYFREHPEITSAWKTQLERFRKSKFDPEVVLEFGEWGEFVRYLEREVVKQ